MHQTSQKTSLIQKIVNCKHRLDLNNQIHTNDATEKKIIELMAADNNHRILTCVVIVFGMEN